MKLQVYENLYENLCLCISFYVAQCMGEIADTESNAKKNRFSP